MPSSRRRRRLTSATATPIATRIGNQYFLLASNAASQPGIDQSGRSRSGHGRSGRSGRFGRGMRGRCQSGSQAQSRSRTNPRASRASSRPATTCAVATTTWRAAYSRGCRCAQRYRRCARVPVGGSNSMRSGREVGAPATAGTTSRTVARPGRGATTTTAVFSSPAPRSSTGTRTTGQPCPSATSTPSTSSATFVLSPELDHPRDETVRPDVEGVGLFGHEVIIECAL